MERAALSIIFNQGRDDEVAELPRRLAQRDQEVAELRRRQEMLERLTADQYHQRLGDTWESLCQAGIRLRRMQVRALVERFIARSRWGVAYGVRDANGTPVTPGPFNFAPNQRGEHLHLETVLLGFMQSDFQAHMWRPLMEYLQLLRESGLLQPRAEGHFERFHVTRLPRLHNEYYESDSEDEFESDEDL